jgi:hypothetical protein
VLSAFLSSSVIRFGQVDRGEGYAIDYLPHSVAFSFSGDAQMPWKAEVAKMIEEKDFRD